MLDLCCQNRTATLLVFVYVCMPRVCVCAAEIEVLQLKRMG